MGIENAVIVVDGDPVTWQRAGQNGKLHYTPKKVAAQEQLIRDTYMMFVGEKIEPPVCMEATFVYRIPKSWPKYKREQAMKEPIPKMSRPDADNLVKLCMDALNGTAYDDDSEITTVISHKEYGAKPRTIIRLTTNGKG